MEWQGEIEDNDSINMQSRKEMAIAARRWETLFITGDVRTTDGLFIFERS
jgi:hypothetical protein